MAAGLSVDHDVLGWFAGRAGAGGAGPAAGDGREEAVPLAGQPVATELDEAMAAFRTRPLDAGP
jgi:hypothetical protein